MTPIHHVLSIAMVIFTIFGTVTSASAEAEAFLEATRASNVVLEMTDSRDQANLAVNIAMSNALMPAQTVLNAEEQLRLAISAVSAVTMAGITNPAIIDPLQEKVYQYETAIAVAEELLAPLKANISIAMTSLTTAEKNLTAATLAQRTSVANYEEGLMTPFAAYTAMTASQHCPGN